jgi:transposase
VRLEIVSNFERKQAKTGIMSEYFKVKGAILRWENGEENNLFHWEMDVKWQVL